MWLANPYNLYIKMNKCYIIIHVKTPSFVRRLHHFDKGEKLRREDKNLQLLAVTVKTKFICDIICYKTNPFYKLYRDAVFCAIRAVVSAITLNTLVTVYLILSCLYLFSYPASVSGRVCLSRMLCSFLCIFAYVCACACVCACVRGCGCA